MTGFTHNSGPFIPRVESQVHNRTEVTIKMGKINQKEVSTSFLSSDSTSTTPEDFTDSSTKLPTTDYPDRDGEYLGDADYISTNETLANTLVRFEDSRVQKVNRVASFPSQIDVAFEVSVTTQVSVTTIMVPVTTILILQNETVTRGTSANNNNSAKKDNYFGNVLPLVNMTAPYRDTITDYTTFRKLGQPHVGEDMFCRLYGWLLITLHVAAVWIIVGLQCDKFIAISSPLRYNTLLTRNRVAAYSVAVWLVAFVASSLPLALAEEFMFTGGACLPAWHIQGSLPFTFILLAVMLFIPGCVIVAINVQIIIIARRHQHRIFSAIFEVMMSAQATVTHQRNPFDVPKKSQKSTRSVVEQLTAFVICYGPVFIVALWETFLEQRIDRELELFGVSLLLGSPLINSFLYGIKCKSLRKSFKNYLRKRLYKSEVRSEIEARIPSGQNSRRPSITSSIAMPFLQRTLKRRMSDYLAKDNEDEDGDDGTGGKIVRRSSDLSWHPLEEGTPSPGRFRKPLDVNFYGRGFSDDGSVHVSQYLTVPTFKAARSYQSLHERGGSIGSIDSECLKDVVTEEEALTTPDVSPLNAREQRRSQSIKAKTLFKEEIPLVETVSMKEFFLQDDSNDQIISPRNKANSLYSSRNTTENISRWQPPGSYTPLLISAYTKPIDPRPVNMSSPYVAQTIDALMSIGLSQSLLKFSSLWRCKSKESLKGGRERANSSSKYVAIPIEVIEKEHLDQNSQEVATFSYRVSANCSSNDISRCVSPENIKKELNNVSKDVVSDKHFKCEDKLNVDKNPFNVNDINVNMLKDVSEVK